MKVRRGCYASYAVQLQNELGGKSFELTQAFADHCARNGFCPTGGAAVLLGKSINRESQSYMRWDQSDTRVVHRIRRETNNQYDIDYMMKRRWRNLIRFANRVHETKRKLKAVRKITRVVRNKPSDRSAVSAHLPAAVMRRGIA